MSGTVPQVDGPEKLLGKQILDFELKSVLGAGGMSVVYRGVHRVTGQEVAIKILPPELAVHDELKARFVEEARLLAKLEHPNIVTLNNFTESAGRLCLIMQFVEGVTFEQKIHELKRMPFEEALRVGIEVLKALEYAHRQNIIHRDIKPSNVLLRPDGVVKVTDFGIAKMIGQTRLTSTGQTMGTVRYMSPEQVRGKPMDARSDLYSLGVTLFEALCGRTPFDGDNQFAIMEQHLNQKPPLLSSLGANVPASVEKALQVSLAKNVADRFPDAGLFRAELERVLLAASAQSELERPLRPAMSRRKVAAALGVVVALGGAAAAYQLTRRQLERNADPAARSPKSTTAGAGGEATSISFSAPYPVAGLVFALDEKFSDVGLRLQSVKMREPQPLLSRYRSIVELLRTFLAEAAETNRPSTRLAATRPFQPLTLAIVPQSVLNRGELWPGYQITADKTYPSRYIATRSTLFVADVAEFERSELPYGAALHVLARVPDLSNEDCLDLAEKFQAFYLHRTAR